LKRFSDVRSLDGNAGREIGDRPADTKHSIASTGTQTEFLNRRFEHMSRPRVQTAVFGERGALELPVEPLATRSESVALTPPRVDDARANHGRWLAPIRYSIITHARSNRRHLDDQIDSIAQRP
jgi:hypothetical protein